MALKLLEALKKTVCNVLDNLPACQDYQMDVQVDQFERISNEINVCCISLPTFERIEEFCPLLTFTFAFETLLKTPAATANRSANS